MRITRRALLGIVVVQLLFTALAVDQSRREIRFPDMLGYKTLKVNE